MMLLLGSSGEVTALGQERASPSASIIEKPLMPARGRIYDCGANAVSSGMNAVALLTLYITSTQVLPGIVNDGNPLFAQ